MEDLFSTFSIKGDQILNSSFKKSPDKKHQPIKLSDDLRDISVIDPLDLGSPNFPFVVIPNFSLLGK